MKRIERLKFFDPPRLKKKVEEQERWRKENQAGGNSHEPGMTHVETGVLSDKREKVNSGNRKQGGHEN